MIRLPRTAMMIMAIGITTMTFVGCDSNKDITVGAIRWNPSPEMDGLISTPNEKKNDQAVVRNINSRQISDDIDAILLLDRSSRLAPVVIPQ